MRDGTTSSDHRVIMFKEVIELHGWLSCIKLPSRRAQRTEASLPKRTHPGEVRGCSYRKVLESDNQIKIRRAKGERGRFSHQQRTLTMTVCCCPLPVRSNVQTSPEVVRLTPLLLLLQFGRVTCSPAASHVALPPTGRGRNYTNLDAI